MPRRPLDPPPGPPSTETAVSPHAVAAPRRHGPSFKPVVALSRGLAILRVVNEAGQATVRGIHRDTGLDKATIVRMLETLEHEGYVMRDPERALYAPTGRTLQLSHGYDQHLWVGAVAEPILGAFRARIGWPSDVAICDLDAMVVVRTSRGQQGPLSFNRKAGYRASLLMTSLGRAYLAFCPADERERIVARLAAQSDPFNDLARHPRKLAALLDEVRRTGFALMDDAYSSREYGGLVWAFGVPVKHGETVFAAINVMMLKTAVTHDEAREKFLPPLREAADRLADALASSASGRVRPG
ncbi:Transcriptional regulator, IclR family [Rhodovulum sp. PH10]|uniref:IclR family transcriptional regulator domain-containing protein n=1 Tax=Rhodovulum sp. PH10 TaxID=1187851 RepID=UPI00027C2DA0|nr:helix-turn-helix domain-containing protein [Rhodovulum sp. PH10]EJW11045.1 Transcriptional regulator, IclR family [Rhodovulum sp. PH10]